MRHGSTESGQFALSSSKRTVLVQLVRGPATIATLARRLDLHSTVVRRHLDDLVRDGSVERAPRRAKGRGRPRYVYQLAVRGRDSIASRYDVVLRLLTQVVLSEEGREETKRLFRLTARSLAHSLGGPGPERWGLQCLAELGFHPELRAGGEVRSWNCPILQLAKDHPELACETFHSEFLRELWGTRKVRLKQTIARGATVCLHELKTDSVTRAADAVVAP